MTRQALTKGSVSEAEAEQKSSSVLLCGKPVLALRNRLGIDMLSKFCVQSSRRRYDRAQWRSVGQQPASLYQLSDLAQAKVQGVRVRTISVRTAASSRYIITTNRLADWFL